MKTSIGLITCMTYFFSSTFADSGTQFTPDDDQPVIQDESEQVTTPPPEQTLEQTRKEVGAAAVDGSETSSNSRVGTYILAGTIVALGIAGLIVVAQNQGHRHRHKEKHQH